MAAAPPSRWKRRIRRILAGLVLTPALLLAVGNLLLATPWLLARIAAKLTARTGLEASVGRAAVTPWGGISLGEVRLLQPAALRDTLQDPVLEIREIRVWPDWPRLARGERAVKAVRIDRPRVTVALEMVASRVRPAPVPASPAAAPPVAVIPVPAGGEAAPPVVAEPVAPVPLPPAPVEKPTVWVEVSDAGGELWLSGKRVFRVHGVDADLPLSGAPATSTAMIGGVEVLDRQVGRDLALPLSWRAPELRCDAVAVTLAGLEMKLTAAIGALPGLPFAAGLDLPAQPLPGADPFPGLKAAAENVEAKVQARGLLRLPATWQAVVAAAAERPAFHRGAQPVTFDEGRLLLLLQGGVLQCPDARLIGDGTSLLGNGWLRADGQADAVLRVVVPPAVAAGWSARFASGGRAPAFAPLETPDREFIDLRWISYPGGPGVELGPGGPVVPAGEILRRLAD